MKASVLMKANLCEGLWAKDEEMLSKLFEDSKFKFDQIIYLPPILYSQQISVRPKAWVFGHASFGKVFHSLILIFDDIIII